MYRNPEEKLILFDYHIGKRRNVPEEFLENFSETLQSDGYTVYQNLTTKGEIKLLGCMAYARRYFENDLWLKHPLFALLDDKNKTYQ